MGNSKNILKTYKEIEGFSEDSSINKITSMEQAGEKVIYNDYQVTPLKGKIPILREWQNKPITKPMVAQYKSCGLGILTGKIKKNSSSVIAIDIDSYNKVISKELIKWCDKNIGLFPYRIGQFPKVLLLFRVPETEPSWKKRASTKYVNEKKESFQIEILAKGQQFVAYGIHPTADKPYTWHRGSPIDIPVDNLTIISKKNIDDLFLYFNKIIGETYPNAEIVNKTINNVELVKSENVLKNLKPKADVTIDIAKLHLEYFDPDMDYDKWIKIGMSLWHEFDGSNDAYELWNDWSSTSIKYDETEMKKKWNSFNNLDLGINPVSYASIISDLKILKNEKKSKGFKLLLWNDFINILPDQEYLIDGIIEQNATGMIYGKTGSYKTFLALDIAMCIATGKDFHGRKVKKGLVVYIAGEGNRGLAMRTLAWNNKYNTNDIVPLFCASNMRTSIRVEKSFAVLNREIKSIVEKYNRNPSLIIIDTVRKNMGVGNENTSEDIGDFLDKIDDLSNDFNSGCMIIHHTNKNGGIRGSSALESDVDFVFETSVDAKSKKLKFTNRKMKDGKSPVPLYFEMQEEEFYIENMKKSSLVPIEIESEIKVIEPPNPKLKKGKVYNVAKNIWQEKSPEPFELTELVKACVKFHKDLTKTSVRTALHELIDADNFGISTFKKGNRVWIKNIY